MSIRDIALLVKRVVQEEFPEKGDIPIDTTPSNDNRSYHINSDKIRRVLGYAPKHTIEEAVRDLCKAFKEGKLQNSMTDDIYYNVRRMKNLKAA
jgi:nucleoside-diphosphate-sugar epimerase